jgi:hypothetical protein
MHAAAPETIASFTPLVTGVATKSITNFQSPSKPLDVSSSPSCTPSTSPLGLYKMSSRSLAPLLLSAHSARASPLSVCAARVLAERHNFVQPRPASERHRLEVAGAIYHSQDPCQAELDPFGRFLLMFRHTGTSSPRGGPNYTSQRPRRRIFC